jgi:hypothetical protein
MVQARHTSFHLSQRFFEHSVRFAGSTADAKPHCSQGVVRDFAYQSGDWRELILRDPVMQSGEALDCLMVMLAAAADAGKPALDWQPDPTGCACSLLPDRLALRDVRLLQPRA